MSDTERPDDLDGYDQDSDPSDSQPIAPQPADPQPGPPAAREPVGARLAPGTKVGGVYTIEKYLGEGGFGAVYRATDELGREVALKVPCPARVADPAALKSLKDEGRKLADLAKEAPSDCNIVRVIAAGVDTENDFPFFLVTQYIHGQNLGEYLKNHQPEPAAAAAILAAVARDLHYAHTRKLLHLDIKPANILLDPDSKPHLGDFGLAVNLFELRDILSVGGTQKYMSPEQARKECYLDVRSDIYSLGVVLFEVLTGFRPFERRQDSSGDWVSNEKEWEDTIDESKPAPSLQEIRAGIPPELDRICQKALCKRRSQRYKTAAELARDLDHVARSLRDRNADRPEEPEEDESRRDSATWFGLAETGDESRRDSHVARSLRDRPIESRRDSATCDGIESRRDSATWVAHCQGPLSFEAKHAAFFLNLLPGPREPRTGLPEEHICFWRDRILQADDGEPFRIGLIYGISGCGKSSLVKAGLLPVLQQAAPELDVVRLDAIATADGTERKLLAALRPKYRNLSAELDLGDTLFVLNGRDILPAGGLLIVLDQFEQWLLAHPEPDGTPLVRALRQGLGPRIKCLVLVRTEFTTGATRFMQAFVDKLSEGSNMKLVDLFDVEHAKRVLAAFGRGYGRIATSGPLTPEQDQFLTAAIQGLAEKEFDETDPAEQGRVKCVRLAMFAFMMKDHPRWEPASIPPGGVTRVGVNFLKSRFDIAAAPHRAYERAAESVLAVLPSPRRGQLARDTTEKRTGYDLLKVSKLPPREFLRLLDILNDERLVTPTDAPLDGDHVAASHVAASLRDAIPSVSERPDYVASPDAIPPVSERPDYVGANPDGSGGLGEPGPHDGETGLGETGLREPRSPVSPRLDQSRLGETRLREPDPSADARLAGYYQLTHDYLVPSIREWLEEKWGQTRRGRARLCLRDRAASWDANPGQAGDRHLPSLWEYLNIRGRIEREVWTDKQAKMMRRAGVVHRKRAGRFLAAAIVVACLVGYVVQVGGQAKGILASANPGEVPALLPTFALDRLIVNAWLRVEMWNLWRADDQSARRLNGSLALLPTDAGQLDYLVPADEDYEGTRLLDLEHDQFLRVLPFLEKHVERSVERLHDGAERAERQFHDIERRLDTDAQRLAEIPAVSDDVAETSQSALRTLADHREVLARRQVNAAIGLMRLGKADLVWPLLKHSPDPRVRSWLENRFARSGIPFATVEQRLKAEPGRDHPTRPDPESRRVQGRPRYGSGRALEDASGSVPDGSGRRHPRCR
jgi:serine/threonine protein kinase